MSEIKKKTLMAIKGLKELGKEPTIWQLTFSAQQGELNIVKLCVEAGIDVNTLHDNRWLPLNLACEYGKTDVVNYLLDNGADINKSDKNSTEAGKGSTPIIKAIAEKRLDIIKLLIERGADLNKVDDFNHTPIIYAYATKDENIKGLLLENGAADLDDAQKKKIASGGKNVLIIAILVIVALIAGVSVIVYNSSSSKSDQRAPSSGNSNCSASEAETFMVRTLENKGWTIENVSLANVKEANCDYLFKVHVVGFGCRLIEIQKTRSGYECIDVQDCR